MDRTPSNALSRRHLLALSVAFIAGGPLAAATSTTCRLGLLGQCVLGHDLRRRPWPGMEPLRALLRSQDACFSTLDGVIRGARAGAPTRKLDTLHAVDPVVLDFLSDFGINVLGMSNNHVFDLNTGGILDTLDALRARQFTFAGIGHTLAEAAAPAVRRAGPARVAIVSAATGMIREGGAATDTRPGVNEIRSDLNEGLRAEDVKRMTEAIRSARAETDIVIAYLHEHQWFVRKTDPAVTQDWQRDIARRMVDAGASVFVAHGPPLMHGIEVYRGVPLFHGLGSLMFQTRKPAEEYGAENWRSVIAECRFLDGQFVEAQLRPVALAAVGEKGHEDFETRGRPSLASGASAAQILDELAHKSQRLGYRLRVRDGRAVLRP
jgi:poly-gamma-glutamate synthesis protein (capsule biosynthesis protein)